MGVGCIDCVEGGGRVHGRRDGCGVGPHHLASKLGTGQAEDESLPQFLVCFELSFRVIRMGTTEEADHSCVPTLDGFIRSLMRVPEKLSGRRGPSFSHEEAGELVHQAVISIHVRKLIGPQVLSGYGGRLPHVAQQVPVLLDVVPHDLSLQRAESTGFPFQKILVCLVVEPGALNVPLYVAAWRGRRSTAGCCCRRDDRRRWSRRRSWRWWDPVRDLIHGGGDGVGQTTQLLSERPCQGVNVASATASRCGPAACCCCSSSRGSRRSIHHCNRWLLLDAVVGRVRS